MDKLFKAAIITEEYSENVFFGGGEKVNSFIIKELINCGYTVDVYTAVSYVNSSSVVNLIIRDKNFDDNFENIMKNYDLVISFNLEYPADISLAHNHSFAYQIEKNSVEKFLERIFSKSYKKRMVKYKKAFSNAQKTPVIIVSSQIVKQDYIKNYALSEDKVHVIPLGVYNAQTDFDECSYNPEKTVVFGLCARKFKNKGGFITLFSAYKLKKLYKNFKIRVISDKAVKNPVVLLLVHLLGLKNYIEFLPLQKNMSDFYKSVDFFLMPTLKDAFGLVVLEAMSFYKPVIISSLCGAVDVINDGVNGIIADFDHADKINVFFDKMSMAMKLNKDEYKLMAVNANKTADSLSWDRFSNSFINLTSGKCNNEV